MASNGFNLDSVGGTAGIEYRINNNAFIGGAFDYSNPKARFVNNAGTTEANAYQIGGYGAWTNSHFFAQALATYRLAELPQQPSGRRRHITSNPDGTSFVVAGKIGYLFDAGRSPDRPIGGLTYARAKVNGDTESGDPVLTLNVGQQTAEALIGSVGAQFRFPFMVSGRIINPYVNLTADDDFIGNGRIIQFGATSAPLIVNNWMVPNATSAACVRSRRGRRGGSGVEQRCADGQCVADIRAPGRQRFLRQRRPENIVLSDFPSWPGQARP